MRNEGMRTVKVKRDVLLTEVLENRDKHEQTYKDALDIYRQEAIAKLTRHLKQARQGGEIVHHLNLTKPEEHLKEYDRVIAMLEVSVDDVIELTEQEFAQYYMDEWSWAHSFETATASYASKKLLR